MRNKTSIMIIGISLTSCTHLDTSSQKTFWEEDCYRNYSETSYDLTRCLDRLEKNQKSTPPSSTIDMEIENTDRPPLNAS